MDKMELDVLDGLSRFWGRESLERFARDTLLLSSWQEVLRNTVAVFGEEISIPVVVTLDGDGDYCIWEGAFLEEAWGTDAWFATEAEAVAHAASLAVERVETV